MLNKIRTIGICLMLGALISTASFAEVRTPGLDPPQIELSIYNADLNQVFEMSVIQAAYVEYHKALIQINSELNLDDALIEPLEKPGLHSQRVLVTINKHTKYQYITRKNPRTKTETLLAGNLGSWCNNNI